MVNMYWYDPNRPNYEYDVNDPLRVWHMYEFPIRYEDSDYRVITQATGTSWGYKTIFKICFAFDANAQKLYMRWFMHMFGNTDYIGFAKNTSGYMQFTDTADESLVIKYDYPSLSSAMYIEDSYLSSRYIGGDTTEIIDKWRNGTNISQDDQDFEFNSSTKNIY